MNADRGTIANLHIKSNLMSGNYQKEFGRVTVFDLADIKRRRPNLPIILNPSFYDNVTPAQRRQWDAHLFWGDKRIGLTEARRLRWLEGQLEALSEAFDEIASRVDEEQAFEILYVVEQLRRTTSVLATRAAEISSLIQEMLRGEVFGHSDLTIEQRLGSLVGDPVLKLERSDGHRSD